MRERMNSNRERTYNGRPPSDELGDLHIFLMPPLLWRDHLHSAIHHIISETISAGFLSLSPETTLHELRDHVSDQMGYEVIPRDYIFLKLVGRVFTKVRSNQEHHLRVRNFPSPQGGYEILVLDAMLASGASSVRSDSRSYDLNFHKPIPPIGSPAYTDNKATQTAENEARSRVTPAVRSSYPGPAGYPYNHSLAKVDQWSPSQGIDLSRSLPRNGVQVSDPSFHGQSKSIALQTGTSPSNLSKSNSIGCQASPQSIRRENPKEVSSRKQIQEYEKHPVSYSYDKPVAVDQGNARNHGNDRHTDCGPLTGSHTPLPPLSASPPASPTPEQRDTNSQAEDADYLPPLSATPPHSADGATRRPQLKSRPAKFTNHTSEDSGISDGLDEDERRRLEELRRREEEERRRREDEERRRREEEERRRREEEERRRREEEERRRWEDDQWDDEERRRREEEERRRREEEERRRREEEERRRLEEEERRRREAESDEDRRRREEEEERRRREEEEERRRREEEERRRREEEERRRREEEERRRREEEERLRREAERTPTPPPFDKDAEKERLREEIAALREDRQQLEKKREELVKRCKVLQGKTHHRRNQARDVWKKRYFEEKKKTPPLEEETNKLRQEMDNLHRRIMSQLEGGKDPKDVKRGGAKPSDQANLKIQATRTNHEIEDLKRRVENVKIKLTSEMKLRNQAETELKSLRADLTQKKIDVTLQRSQQIGAMSGFNGVDPEPQTARSQSPLHITPRS